MKMFNLKAQLKNPLNAPLKFRKYQIFSMTTYCYMSITIFFILINLQAKSQTCVGDITPPIITCTSLNINNTPGLCGANINLTTPSASDNCSLIGNALHFDGSNDKIMFPGSFPAYNGNTLTLEAWIKSTNGGPGFPNSEIVLWDGGAGHSIVFRIANYLGNGRLQFLIFDNVTVQFVEGTTDLNTNTWNHVAAVKNGNNVTLYLNGNIEASGTMTNGFVPAQCSIGGGGGASWDGTLDEVRIWHSVRTQAQIQASMNIPLTAQPGLVALYHFDEGEANGNNVAVTTANDASGNGFHGTLSTFALTGSTSNWVGGTITNITNNAPSTFPVGITNVVWTATDASGNTATCEQVVTVSDAEAPVFVGNALTAAPILASSNVPEASQYKVVYELDMPVNADFENSAIPYTIDNSAVSGIDFSRVAYFMQLDNNWVWVSMDKFNPTVSLTQLGIPNVAFNNVVWQQTVSNMNVVSNVGSGVTNASGISGNVEMWHKCYVSGLGLGGIGGNSGNYDFNDLMNSSNSCFGSFQVHNYNAAQTIFAYNAWDTGETDGLGFGNQSTGEPDWTYAQNANTYSTRKLYILVNPVGGQPNVTVNVMPGNCQAVATYTTTPTDNCGIATVTYTPASGSTFNVGTTPVSVSATDIHGNSSSYTFNVIVIDNESPTISCPANISQNIDAGLCTATVITPDPITNDNCGIDKLTWVMSGATSASSASTGINNIGTFVCNKGISTVVYTLTDISGNTATCSFTITVIDNIPPIIACAPDVNVNNTAGMCNASVNLVAPVVSHNCQSVGHALDFDGTNDFITTNYILSGSYTKELWIFVRDISNNANNFITSGGGTISTPHYYGGYLGAGNGSPWNTVSDNVAIALNSWIHVAVTYDATSQEMKLYKNGILISTASSVPPPTPDYVQIGAWYGGYFTNGKMDEVRVWNHVRTQAEIQSNMNVEISTPEPGLMLAYHFNQGIPGGPNVAENIAIDASGYSNSGTLNNFALSGATSNWVEGIINSNLITNNAPSIFPIGTTYVIWTATDASGNAATCEQVVTVSDIEAPILQSGTTVTDYTFSTSSSENLEDMSTGSISIFGTGVDDEGSAPIVMPFNFSYNGVIRNQFSVSSNGLIGFNNVAVTNDFSNSTNDNYPDVLYAYWDDLHTGTNGSVIYKVVGNAPNRKLVIQWQVRSFSNDGGAGFTKTFQAWLYEGNSIVEFVYGNGTNSGSGGSTIGLRGLNASSFNEVTTTTHTNSITSINDVNVVWPGAGRLYRFSLNSCPANITAYSVQGSCDKSVSWTAPIPTDNCAIATLTSNFNPGDLFPLGTTTVVYTATDIHGNSSTCSFDVTVIDTNLFATCPQNITANTDAFQCAADLLLAVPTFTNCAPINSLTWVLSGVTTAASAGSGINYLGTTTFNKGTTTVTYTAINSFGHVSHCSFTVQVNDSIPPVITCSPINLNNTPGMCNASVNLVAPVVSDNCSMAPNLALDFNGTPNYATLPPDVYFNGNFTIECWVYPKAFSNWSRIIDFGNGAGSNNVLLAYTYGTSGRPGLYIQGIQIQSTATLPLNQWSHIAATFNSGTGTIYVNGLPAGSGTFPTPANIVRNLNYIGRSNWGAAGDPDANAIYDELRIWNIARTQSQIQSTMNNSLLGNESGLQVYFNFNQGTACGNNTGITQLQDAASAGGTSNATLFNFSLNGSCTKNFTNGVPVINNSGIVNNAPPIYPVGTTNVLWTAIDASGNTATCEQVVTVTDTEAPVFNTPSLLAVDFESGSLPSGWSATGLWHITSSCITGTPPNPTKWAYFGNDATCNFNLGTVSGSLSAPAITIPVSAINPTLTFKSIYSGEGGTPYDLAALRVNGTQILNVSSSFPPNTWNTVSVNLNAYIGQTITLDWYFNSVDGIANGTLGWQVDSIRLQSSEGSCPSNIVAFSLQGSCDKNVSWTAPIPSDNCAIATLTSNFNPGDLFPLGTTTVVYTATDIHGNSSTCSFDVTVIDTNLFATCPQNITANTDAFQCAADLLLAVPTFTNCSPINSLTWVLSGATTAASAGSGINYLGTTTFNKGTTIVTYTATNSFGHVSHCSFTVQVNDSIPPTIICSPNITVNHDEGICGASVNLISPSISDNCPINLLTNALNFDGVNDHVILPEFNLGTSDFTLETWINPTVNSDDYLISNRTFEGAGCCNWFSFSHQSDGKIYFEVASNGTPNYVSFASNTTVPLNAWSHIAVVRNGLTMTIYINGVADVVYTDNFIRNVSTGNYVLLGGFPYYNAAFYNGSMSEVRVWNIARTGSQILNNMNIQIPAQSGLQNYYSMNQGIANSNNAGVNTLIDDSGNGYNGSLNNFALTGSTSNWVNRVISNITNNAPSIFPIGSTNVVWTAIDASGNTATCSQVVTVNPPAGSTTTTTCDAYTWVENSNAVYTVSGNYTQTFTTSYGCDSIHTLNLTVNYSSKTITTISTIGCYTWLINGGTYTTSGIYTNTYTNGVGCLHTDSLYLTITPEVLLHAKAILQGPYDASIGLMHDSLRIQNAIPTLEPYSQPPYNKPAIGEAGGELLNLALLTTIGNDAIVDWIFLELRDAINPSIIVATKRALIQRDGDIVSHVDGLSPIHFLNTPAGNYYISVKHRNHLGVMTAAPIALSQCAGSSIDFSNLTPVYANPAIQNLPRKNLVGLNALWSADASNNKNVKYNGALNDKDKIMNGVGGPGLINNIVYGYRVEDCNMDGKIRYNGLDNDRILIINNVGVSTPNNVLFQHTPN